MAWTYTSNPADIPLDHVRFLIGDTDETEPLMQDEELNFLLSEHENTALAARKAGQIILGKLAREIDYTIGPESVKASQRFQQYRRYLKDMGLTVSEDSGVPIWAGPTQQESNSVFGVGMHDNRGPV